MYIFLGIIIVAIIYIIITAKKKPNENESNETSMPIETAQPQTENTDYSKSYQAKLLLTKNEWHEYKKLKQYAESKGLQVFPKVRLLDIIEPRRGEQHYKSLFYKIQAKHIDFLICDQSAYIKAIVELDDNSHNQTDRKERDEFVDQVLTSVGYTVIRTRSITEETLANI